MKSYMETLKTIHLTLEPKEAEWLHSFTQNCYCDPSDEDPDCALIREKLFNTLKDFLNE
jgi:hypothetical protein